jgi:hypothetical protein
MHKRQSRAEEQFSHELIGFARFFSGNRSYQFDPNRRLESIGLTQQKIHMLTKKLIEEMDILIGTRNIKNIVQRHFRTNQVMPLPSSANLQQRCSGVDKFSAAGVAAVL